MSYGWRTGDGREAAGNELIRALAAGSFREYCVKCNNPALARIVRDVEAQPELIGEFERALTPQVYQRAWRYACWLSRTREQAEDLLQESLVKALRCFGQLQSTASFKSWLLKIVRNTHLMQQRSRTSGISAITGELSREAALVDLSTQPDAQPLADELASALERLPEPQQELLALFYFEDLSLKEIARVLDTTPNAALQRLHRARRALRRLMAGNQESAKARLTTEG